MNVDGLILFGHGARDPAWAQPFEAVAQLVRVGRPALPLRLAYLEFMTPDLPTAGAALVEEGCRHIAILPLFLGAGGHVRRDLPAAVELLRQTHPAVSWTVHAAVGEMPDVLQAIARATLNLLPAADDLRP